MLVRSRSSATRFVVAAVVVVALTACAGPAATTGDASYQPTNTPTTEGSRFLAEAEGTGFEIKDSAR